MEKQQIIKFFLEKGRQLDSEVLEYLCKDEKNVELLLNNLGEIKDSTITIDVLGHFLKKPALNIKILKERQARVKKIFVENFTQIINNRYNFSKKILETRMDLVNPISINKISPKTKKFSLIAMIKEKDDATKSAVLEDSTGETNIFFKSNTNLDELMVDDTTGFVCEIDDGVVKVERVIFPDIPLKKEASKTKEDVYCLFISDILFENTEFKKKSFQNFLDWLNKSNYPNLIIFVLGNVSTEKNKLKEFFEALPKSVKIFQKREDDADTDLPDIKISSPCFLEIGGVVVLVCNDNFLLEYKKTFKKTTDMVLLNLLKRRNLDPFLNHKKEIYENDPFLIEIVPDIIVAGNVFEPSQVNYKSTTILTNGSFANMPIFWLVNLKDREIIKLDFT